MPEPAFRGDPYAVLDVPSDAAPGAIKRRWRELAREHHPDRAAGDAPEQQRLTARMARINAAYDLLRDPVRRARHDASPAARRHREASHRDPYRDPEAAPAPDTRPGGPPPARPTRPVTGRFDTSAAFHGRNTTTSEGRPPLRGHVPIGRRSGDNELRASTPTGPIHRRASAAPPRQPSLEEALGMELEFGKFGGMTLAEVARLEPTYIDWIARTITRDRDLVMCARVVSEELDRRGVVRHVRRTHPGFGSRDEGGGSASAGG